MNLFGGIHISDSKGKKAAEIIARLEELEKTKSSVPMIFTEMFKDEINANDEIKMYNGVKRVIKKYTGDGKAMSAINEFTSVLSGGASLEEILVIAVEEAGHPTAATEITIENQ